ncbi:hypothetical protein KEM54_002971 [Ascosphaera aggregata]|nr:hypothetical protein KEM54_002971 [Ascosphaera aggregata]
MGQSACWTERQNCSEYPEEMNPAAAAAAAAAAPTTTTTATTAASTQNEGIQSGGSDSSSPLINKSRVANRPSRRSQRTRKTRDFKTASSGSHITDDPFLDDSSCADSDFGEEELKQVKLKGILWPGMDIFDSATEQMRKKRNQKKDDSVLKRMEITSKTIEPTEQVFSPCGTLQVERVITGNPDDYSPIKGETPIPPPSKKRSIRTRRPLSKSDGNLYNLRNRVRKSAEGPNQTRASLEEISRQALPLLEPENSPLSSAKQFDSFSDDFSMSYANAGKRQRHGFSIFNERNEDELNYEEDWMVPRPAASTMGSFPPVRAFQQIHNSNPLSGSCTTTAAAVAAAAAAAATSTYPYTFVKPYALHRSSTMPECSTNKENVDPYGNTADYPCYFPPPGSQMNFGLLHDSNPFGHGRNPLSCTFPSPLQDEALAKNSLKYPAFESSHVKRELSPDGALLDLDKEDFANVLHGF